MDTPYSERNRAASVERTREAIRRVAAHAEQAFTGWQQAAIPFIESYGRLHGEFIAEDVRHWAEERGLPIPPSKRAWGPLMLKAERLGLVVRCGLARAADANQAYVVKWRLT